MSLAENFFKDIPEYYHYMHLNEYTPDQIMYAARKKFHKELAECIGEQNQICEIKVISEVKVK